MKYKVGDEVLIKAKIITGVRKYFGVEVEDNRFDVCEDDIIPVPDMTAEEAVKEIKVGDVVDVCGDIGVVTSFGTDENSIHVLFSDGIVTSYRKDKCIKKTGRRIDIDGFLKQIGGDE